MPTGPEHRRITEILIDENDDSVEVHTTAPCRCTRGEDHQDDDIVYGTIDHDQDDDGGETLDPSYAEDIWRSSGMDEDYDFR